LIKFHLLFTALGYPGVNGLDSNVIV